MSMTFAADEDFARQLDAEDSLRHFRERFHLPLGADGKPVIYLAGNSLGLMPKAARQIVEQELDDWAKLAVDAHLDGATPWQRLIYVVIPLMKPIILFTVIIATIIFFNVFAPVTTQVTRAR